MGPLDGPLQLGKKKKVTQSKIMWTERLFPCGDVFLGLELPVAQGILSRCIVMVKQPWFVLPQLSSFLNYQAKHTPQDLLVDLLIHHLTLWQELVVDIEEPYQHDFDCLAFFGLSDVRDFHWLCWCLVSGSYSKFHISPIYQIYLPKLHLSDYICQNYMKIYHWLIGLVGRVFSNGPGDMGLIPGRVMPKTLKMVLDTSLLNTQQYKVRIKDKVEQSRERSSAFSYTSV